MSRTTGLFFSRQLPMVPPDKEFTLAHYEWLHEFQKTYNAFVQQTSRELAALRSRVDELES